PPPPPPFPHVAAPRQGEARSLERRDTLGVDTTEASGRDGTGFRLSVATVLRARRRGWWVAADLSWPASAPTARPVRSRSAAHHPGQPESRQFPEGSPRRTARVPEPRGSLEGGVASRPSSTGRRAIRADRRRIEARQSGPVTRKARLRDVFAGLSPHAVRCSGAAAVPGVRQPLRPACAPPYRLRAAREHSRRDRVRAARGASRGS